MDKTTLGHIHNGIPLDHKKEDNVMICDSIDGPGEYYGVK